MQKTGKRPAAKVLRRGAFSFRKLRCTGSAAAAGVIVTAAAHVAGIAAAAVGAAADGIAVAEEEPEDQDQDQGLIVKTEETSVASAVTHNQVPP